MGEQMKVLTEKTTNLEATSGSLQSAVLFLTNKVGKIEEDLDNLTKTVQENDSSEITNELQQLDAKLAEHDSKLSELDNSIQSNATQLQNQNLAIQKDKQELDNELLE